MAGTPLLASASLFDFIIGSEAQATDTIEPTIDNSNNSQNMPLLESSGPEDIVLVQNDSYIFRCQDRRN